MTMRRLNISAAIRRYRAGEEGATLVEFALVVLFFLFLLFAIIDFGRLAYAWSSAQKATQVAARVAAVREPACGGVPQMNARGAGGAGYRFGTMCSVGANLCLDPGTISCTGNPANATVTEIFRRVRPLLPVNATEANLRFTYRYDANLGFLGGPYVPMVTVDLEGLQFEFVSNLGRMIGPLIGTTSTLGADIALPRMSVTTPGEDLALGTAG